MIWLCGIPVILVAALIIWTIVKSGSNADDLTARIHENMRKNEK